MCVKCVIIDKRDHMLYIVKDEIELYKFLSGESFTFIYKKRINSFTNVTLPTIKKGRNETYRNVKNTNQMVYNEKKGKYESENPLNLFEIKLIHNCIMDITHYNYYTSENDTAKYINLKFQYFLVINFFQHTKQKYEFLKTL